MDLSTQQNGVDSGRSYEEKMKYVSAIAQPLASEKLAKRLLKLARKAKRTKNTDIGIKTGLKLIEKKGVSGIMLLAGDTSPIDLISHVPLVCEEHDIPYCYVPCRFDLGASVVSSAPTTTVFITRDDSYGELYDKCYAVVNALPLPL